jgi:putative transposase
MSREIIGINKQIRGGSTPLQAWNGDPSALVRVDGAKLRHLLLAGVERTIGKDGIHFNGLVYVAPEMQERRGLVVDVRYMPHDDRCVEVYLAGTHLCTAYPQGQLSDEQVQAFRAHARAEAKRLSAARRRASARARAELVALHGRAEGGDRVPVGARGCSDRCTGRSAGARVSSAAPAGPPQRGVSSAHAARPR